MYIYEYIDLYIHYKLLFLLLLLLLYKFLLIQN